MDAKDNGNESAYPEQLIQNNDAIWVPASQFAGTGGLTKREIFAMAAMQGLASSNSNNFQIHTDAGTLIVPARKAIPALAVQYADALLAELAEKDA